MWLDIAIAGEPMRLDVRRALVWPRRRWLLVADVHLGKASLLRQAGAPLPRGTTTRDLERLAALVADHRPERLVVLGDLVHGHEPADAAWLATFLRWREAHATLPVTLVAGNHDRHGVPAAFAFQVVDEIMDAPFVLRHAPGLVRGAHVIAGHVHPGVVLRDGRVRHRLPAFWSGPQRTLLPAFGSLCGLAPVAAQADDAVYAVTPGGVLAMPAGAVGR